VSGGQFESGEHTLEVEQNIRLVVLEHLSNKLYIHVLNVDVLEGLIHHHNSLVEFLLCCCKAKVLALSIDIYVVSFRARPYHIGDDARKQKVLLMLMGALLILYQQ
jgi:hypothetical protein